MAKLSGLRGVYSAQWIPVAADGKVDRTALRLHLRWERSQGVAGVLALGSTGEFPFFTLDERKEIVAMLAELGEGLQLIVNVSDIRPAAAVELARSSREAGAIAVALMPPMFFPVSPADMLAYFLHVADGTELPVMLYNFPELTGKRIPLEVVAAFADRAAMAGIKQSGAEFEYHRELIALGREKGFAVMSGADTRLPEAFEMGATGCIGGLVNIVPDLMVGIYRAIQEGRPEDATTAAARMTGIGRVIDQLTFPQNVAAGLVARGFHPGVPKSILSAESIGLAARITADLGLLFQEWRLTTDAAAAWAGNSGRSDFPFTRHPT